MNTQKCEFVPFLYNLKKLIGKNKTAKSKTTFTDCVKPSMFNELLKANPSHWLFKKQA